MDTGTQVKPYAEASEEMNQTIKTNGLQVHMWETQLNVAKDFRAKLAQVCIGVQ